MPLFKKELSHLEIKKRIETWFSDTIDIVQDTIDEDVVNMENKQLFQLGNYCVLKTVKEASDLYSYMGGVHNMGQLLLEFRLYFDCVWQYVIIKDEADKEKVDDIFVDVNAIERTAYEVFLEDNIIKQYIGELESEHNADFIYGAVMRYIPIRLTDNKENIKKAEKHILNKIDNEYWIEKIGGDINYEALKMAHKLFDNLLEFEIIAPISFDGNLSKKILMQFYQSTIEMMSSEYLIDIKKKYYN